MTAIELLDMPEWENHPVIIHNEKLICCSNAAAQKFQMRVPMRLFVAEEIKDVFSSTGRNPRFEHAQDIPQQPQVSHLQRQAALDHSETRCRV